MKFNNKGFTLVELSIVIVIIGLIIAGVSAGQTLVKQAQLRSILTQADQIRTAVNTFRSQYGGYPGDIKNGSSYWSAITSSGNGNGDKKIGTVNLATTVYSEGTVAWYSLNQAGLFLNSVNPIGSTLTAGNATPGTFNTLVPNARFPNTAMTLGYDTNQLTGQALNKNIILFGAAATSNYAYTAFLTPPQASSLDTKADDGKGNAGNIYGGASAASGTACQSSGTYALSTTTNTCTIAFAL